MATKISSLKCNKFGGIRRINATFASELISASDLQNVELFNTGINSGVGIRTAKGNISVCNLIPSTQRIINIFESVQNNNTYFFVHTEDSQRGKIYLLDVEHNTLTQKVTNLTLTGNSCGLDIAQGWSDLFVFSNGENLLSIEIGANPEVVVMNLQDMEGRTVKGLGLVNYNNRLWIFNNNILWYSVQENIYDFSTSDAQVSTSSGFIEYVKNITAIIPYLGSLAIFFKNSSILLSGEYPYTQSDESPGGCASYNALVFHGTELYFYDDTKKGVFSFNQIVTGDKTLGDNIALDIQEELCFIDPSRLNEIRALSIVLSDRNEIWFLIPTTEPDVKTIMIFDYIHKEWVKRKCPDVTCFNIINNTLYSGGENGNIYEEYKTDTFNGEFIRSFYKCTPLNLGVDNTLKILYFPPRVTIDMTYSSDFWVRYIKNYDTFKAPKVKQIKIKTMKNALYFDVGHWDSTYFPLKELNSIYKLPSATFKTLEIQLYTYASGEGFCIKNIEFSKIKVKQI
ncbi:hypothetical protein IJ674_10425 [bacterium]|nr:hypothetical protein [bacterium]